MYCRSSPRELLPPPRSLSNFSCERSRGDFSYRIIHILVMLELRNSKQIVNGAATSAAPHSTTRSSSYIKFWVIDIFNLTNLWKLPWRRHTYFQGQSKVINNNQLTKISRKISPIYIFFFSVSFYFGYNFGCYSCAYINLYIYFLLVQVVELL